MLLMAKCKINKYIKDPDLVTCSTAKGKSRQTIYINFWTMIVSANMSPQYIQVVSMLLHLAAFLLGKMAQL